MDRLEHFCHWNCRFVVLARRSLLDHWRYPSRNWKGHHLGYWPRADRDRPPSQLSPGSALYKICKKVLRRISRNHIWKFYLDIDLRLQKFFAYCLNSMKCNKLLGRKKKDKRVKDLIEIPWKNTSRNWKSYIGMERRGGGWWEVM